FVLVKASWRFTLALNSLNIDRLTGIYIEEGKTAFLLDVIPIVMLLYEYHKIYGLLKDMRFQLLEVFSPVSAPSDVLDSFIRYVTEDAHLLYELITLDFCLHSNDFAYFMS